MKRVAELALILTGSFLFAGCPDESPAPDEGGSIGDAVDDAMESAGDAGDDAAEAAGDAVDDAAEAIEEAVEEAAEAVDGE